VHYLEIGEVFRDAEAQSAHPELTP
jgi:hypothetical protein